MQHRHRVPGSAGLTLLELLLALVVASLLVAWVAPGWQRQAADAELRERAEALAADMARARSEAILRGMRVDVCPSADRNGCSAAAGWEAGWVAFPNEAAEDSPAAPEHVLARERGARAGITIRGNAPVARYVSYTPLGHARRHDGALQMGSFTVCRSGLEAVKIILANSGRTRIDATQEICP
jgi:type IV fimbrial biogenesis protein FimT